jgi:succinyl-CoA synthetase beta subunit
VVLKAVSDAVVHKTEAGAVKLDLGSADDVRTALTALTALRAGPAGQAQRFLVERMARDVVAELLVGVRRESPFGLALTLGAGGVLVELVRDVATILLPASRAEVAAALTALRTGPLLTGYRGRPVADVEAVLDAVAAIVRFVESRAACLVELEVNPLLVLPEGRGVLAADVLVRLNGEEDRRG